ncbi:UspA domain protein [Desulfarculus baarsii DSM 2075]|uniref:UspA domain protein n=1 Tax=Desulfarculus baarsii (strain ATCC 33931 / DSM 2075 / LMG 7858 / VKM B-1802 / 2st14) TaxID=644282 RepID=E1QG63_DESB2|nr:universal stress protein [Desulfarculus baarsii]ADK83575.1 UspA domain protein [Desulfarculus baarsii DSM 2075]
MIEGPIIAATDFSKAAEQAVAQAARLAAQRGVKLVLAHVIPPLITPTPLLDEIQVSQVTADLRREMRQAAEREMQRLRQIESALTEVETVIAEGEPTRELAALCQSQNAALLVVGAAGAGNIVEAVFGSVARKMVRRAPCSVLVVRPEEAD